MILYLQSLLPRRYVRSIIIMLFLAMAVGAIFYGTRKNRGENRTASSKHGVVKPASKLHIPELKEIVGIFEPHQTVSSVLLKQGLSKEQIYEIIESARPVYNLARVKSRQLYWLCFKDGKFSDFRYPIDENKYLTVYRDQKEDRLVPVVKNFPYETRVEVISGAIESSLFASISALGEKDQLALDLADIFSSDIDFYTDLQKGDSYKVLIEKKYINNQFANYGAILAASFNNNKKEFTGFRFEDAIGKPAYFAPDGRSLKKSFLKSPLKFARITSTFSHARMHPVLKIVRPHLGVDYAAATGTPVQAVGNGVVTLAGYGGGGGNTVRLRHSNGYETSYMHLSRIAVGNGARVSQGQVIGYVGATGLATGPHLDFRVYKSGSAVNPLKVISPPGDPVSPSQFARFAQLCDSLRSQLHSESLPQEARNKNTSGTISELSRNK